MWAACSSHVVPGSWQEVERREGRKADAQLSMALRDSFLVGRETTQVTSADFKDALRK